MLIISVKSNDLQSASDNFERALELAEQLDDSSAEKAIRKALEEVNDKIVRGVKDDDDDDDDRRSHKSDRSQGERSGQC